MSIHYLASLNLAVRLSALYLLIFFAPSAHATSFLNFQESKPADKTATTAKPKTKKTKVKQAKPKATQQVFNNTQDGIQAGRDVIINQVIPPRKLNEEQQAKFISILKANPTGRVKILCIGPIGDEPCMFASQLMSLLGKSGWDVGFAQATFYFGDDVQKPELYVEIQSEKNLPVRASALRKALREAGFVTEGFYNPEVEADGVRIVVRPRKQ